MVREDVVRLAKAYQQAHRLRTWLTRQDVPVARVVQVEHSDLHVALLKVHWRAGLLQLIDQVLPRVRPPQLSLQAVFRQAKEEVLKELQKQEAQLLLQPLRA